MNPCEIGISPERYAGAGTASGRSVTRLGDNFKLATESISMPGGSMRTMTGNWRREGNVPGAPSIFGLKTRAYSQQEQSTFIRAYQHLSTICDWELHL